MLEPCALIPSIYSGLNQLHLPLSELFAPLVVLFYSCQNFTFLELVCPHDPFQIPLLGFTSQPLGFSLFKLNLGLVLGVLSVVLLFGREGVLNHFLSDLLLLQRVVIDAASVLGPAPHLTHVDERSFAQQRVFCIQAPFLLLDRFLYRLLMGVDHLAPQNFLLDLSFNLLQLLT